MIKRVFFGIIFLVLSVPYSLVYGLLMIVLFFTGKRILNRFEECFVDPILEVCFFGRRRNEGCCGNCVSFLYESANGSGWCEKKKKLRFCGQFCKEHKIKCNKQHE